MERDTGEMEGLVKKTRIVAARRAPVEAEAVDTGAALVADPRRTEEDREEELDPIAARDQEDKQRATSQPTHHTHNHPPTTDINSQHSKTHYATQCTTKPETRSQHRVGVPKRRRGKDDVYVGKGQ